MHAKKKKVFEINPVKCPLTPQSERLSCAPDQPCDPSDSPEGPYLPCLRFAFRRIGYREREERCRSTQIGGLRRAVQSPVYPKPFVVMCHTPARQYASWSGQQQTQLAEPRPRSRSFPLFPLLCRLQLTPPPLCSLCCVGCSSHPPCPSHMSLTAQKQKQISLDHIRNALCELDPHSNDRNFYIGSKICGIPPQHWAPLFFFAFVSVLNTFDPSLQG